MSTAALLRIAAWFVAVAAMVGALAVWDATPPPAPEPPLRSVPDSPGAARPTLANDSATDSAAAAVQDRNPFRLDGRRSAVPFGRLQAESLEPETADELVMPVVAGFAGPPWVVLVEGLPGAEEGVLLSLGEDAQGFRFTEMRGDTVVLTSPDATWVLTARQPWP